MQELLTETDKPHALFEQSNRSLLEAIAQAQFIAFAPYVFEVSLILRDKGILKHLEDAPDGLYIDDLTKLTGLSHYATRVLMEASLGIGLACRREGKYHLSNTGHIFQNNKMTRINTDFMRDVCIDSARDLESSLMNGKPMGLQRYGNWNTVYEALNELPGTMQKSWYAFDHFYSDNVFPEALPLIFEQPTHNILDIGTNTGKWAISCLNYNPDVKVGVVDLPVIIDLAKQNIAQSGHHDRIAYYGINLLDPNAELPGGYDVMWMSQFLTCFTDQQIIAILKKCYNALPANGRIFINDTFWDTQRHEPPAFCLQMTSLYFTTIANGNSQIYDSNVYLGIIEQSNFEVVRQLNGVGRTHTILELRKK